MGSLADDDHKQLVSICRDFRYGRKTLEEASREVVTRCRYEITDGLTEALDLLVFGTPEDGKRLVLLLAYLSAERAVTTAQDKRPDHLPKYVQDCAEAVARETTAGQEAWLKGLTPDQILNIATMLPRRQAALVLDRLSLPQLDALMELVHRRRGEKRTEFRLTLEHEPKDALLWLAWYAARLIFKDQFLERPDTRKNRPPVTFLLINSGGRIGVPRKNKRGEPIDLAGPLHAKFFQRLGRELSKHGHDIKDPLSVSRIARSLGVDRDVVNRYLKRADELPDPIPDGEGGVYMPLTPHDLLRSAEIATPNKPGPSPKFS
jgi:hypothetical protein